MRRDWSPKPSVDRKWKVCREAMVRLGIVKIVNREFGPGKAMKWEVGDYFPFLGMWKSSGKKKIGGLTFEEFLEALKKEKKRERRGHNTLLLKQFAGQAEKCLLSLARPPPWGRSSLFTNRIMQKETIRQMGPDEGTSWQVFGPSPSKQQLESSWLIEFPV